MTLIALKYSYEGVALKDGGSDKSLVGCVGNQVDEVVYCLVDLFGGEVRRWGMGKSVELIELESALFLVAPLSEELARAGNLEGTLGTR